MARALVLGDAEAALKIALTAPLPFLDRTDAKREKIAVAPALGQLARLKELLPPSHARSLVDYLDAHPEDFLTAIARLRPDLRGLYLSAYQSHLWNRMLAGWLQAHLDPLQLVDVPMRPGPLPMYRCLTEPQQTQLAGPRAGRCIRIAFGWRTPIHASPFSTPCLPRKG